MKGKELIFEVLNGNAVQRSPWVPYTGAQIANLKGYAADEMFQNADKYLECLLEAHKQYLPDGMPAIFDLQVEAEILGCELAWYKNSPPTVCSHPLASDFIIPTQKINKTDGRIPLILDVMKGFKAACPDTAMYGLVCGPFTLASHLRGTDIFMDMYDDEEKVKELINYSCEVVKQLADYYIEVGCDVIAAVDPLVSQISPEMFENFMQKPYADFFKHIKSAQVFSSFFVCGDATKNIEPMCLTKPDCIAIDENVDIVKAKSITDKYGITISGNLQLTITMLLGTQQDNQKAAIELMDSLGTQNFILAPGCDMPFDTPSSNIVAVGQAVHSTDAVRKSIENYVASDDLPDVEISNFKANAYVTCEVITIDSFTCAACGYMLAAANAAAKDLGDNVKVVERSIMHKETLAYITKIGLANLPSIVIDGEIRHISLIPPVDTLKKELENAFQAKK